MTAVSEHENLSYTFGPFSVKPADRLLLRDGEPVPLLPKSFDTLLVLVRNSGRLLGKRFLMGTIWPDAAVEENSLAKAVSEVRKALGECPKERHYIVTVPRLGYRFAASVTIVRDAGPGAPGSGEERGRPGDEVGARPRIRSIAVLPFVQGRVDGEDRYLAVGLADALITRLSNIARVAVRPTSSILKYADATTDPVVAGKELQADGVICGSIRRAGERIRVTVQFVSVDRQSSLWADKYDAEVTDLFAVEDLVAERVAIALAPRLTGDERRSLEKRPTDNAEAYDLYLRGRYFSSKRTFESAKRAIEYLRQAITLDPGFALAHAGLADAHIILGLQGALAGWLPAKDTYPEARRAALAALERDDDLAEAHASLAFTRFFFDWDWPGAREHFRRAIELNAHYATAHHWYAMALAFMMRPDEALAEVECALEIEPLSLIVNANRGYVLYYARRYDDAVERLQKSVEMEPNFGVTRHRLGLAYEAKGLYEPAIAEFQLAVRMTDRSPQAVGALGHAYAVSGRREAARQVLDELFEASAKHFVSAAIVADVFAGLGDADEALDWLERAYDERTTDLVKLKVDPRYDRLRTHVRFLDLVRRIGL